MVLCVGSNFYILVFCLPYCGGPVSVVVCVEEGGMLSPKAGVRERKI